MDKFIVRECTSGDLDYVLNLQHQWVKEDITHGLIPVEKDYLKAKLGEYFMLLKRMELIGV